MTPRNYFVTIDWLRHDKKYVVIVRLPNKPDENTVFENYNEATRHYFKRLDEIHQEQS